MNFSQEALGRGLRAYLCETEKFKTLTMKVFIQQDLSVQEATSTALVPLLLRRGSQKFPSTRHIAQELEELYAADYGSDVLKIGERQILEFYFQIIDPALLPRGEDLLRRGVAAFLEIATNPLGEGAFAEPYFSQEKRTLEQELKGLVNDKRSYAYARSVALMCQGEPFGIYKYGDLAVLEGLKNEEVYRHYRRLLTDYPLDIFIIGPQARKACELLVDKLQERPGQIRLRRPQQVKVGEPRYFEEVMDVQQSILIMGYRTNLSYLDPNYYGLLVGNGVLGGFAHSKLFLNVREKASLAYYIGSSIEGSKGLLTISAGISDDTQGQAVEIIQEQVAEVQQGRISQEELEQTKRGLIAAMNSMNDNPAALIDRNLIGIVHNELRTIEEVVDAINGVTREDVVQALAGLQLDTTYVLRPPQGRTQGPEQEGAENGAD